MANHATLTIPGRGNMAPRGATYPLGGTITISVISGNVYYYVFGANDTSITNGVQTINGPGSGTFTANGTTITVAGTAAATVTITITPNTFAKASVASRLTSNNGSIRPCRIDDVNAENYTSGVLYLHYFDGLTAVPANGTKPDEGFPVQANLGGQFGTSMDCQGGIWAWSSTESTFTAAGASGSIVIYLWSGG